MGKALGPGHLFLLQGDLTRLALDDVILPCDDLLQVSSWVAPLLPAGAATPTAWGLWQVQGIDSPDDFTADRRSPIRLCDADGRWAHREPGASGPRVWLMNSPISRAGAQAGIAWLAAGLASALQAIAASDGIASDSAAPANGRERHVIGVPLFGVGAGGFAAVRTQVMRRLLDTLQAACSADGAPDVVLVLRSRADYEAFQSIRDEPALPEGIGQDRSGPDGVDAVLTRLTAHARAGHLVPFIGAGVSAAAGMDTWTALLSHLADQVQDWPDGLREAIVALPPEDAAQAIANRIGTPRIRDILCARMDLPRHSIAHGLLAGFRFREAITTNYDRLYEAAFDAAHGPGSLKVLPGEPANSDESEARTARSRGRREVSRVNSASGTTRSRSPAVGPQG